MPTTDGNATEETLTIADDFGDVLTAVIFDADSIAVAIERNGRGRNVLLSGQNASKLRDWLTAYLESKE